MDKILNIKSFNTKSFWTSESLLIGLIIIIILFLLLKIFYKKKHIIPSPSKMILISNKKRVLEALKSAGFELYTKETFDDNKIVFNSKDKINNNFEQFMDTYLPLIDMKTINTIFREYNININMQKEVTEKLLDITKIFHDPFGFVAKIVNLVYSTKNKTDLILLGICSALLMKIQYNLLSDYKVIYFDDYNEETTDFILYFIPLNYTENISKIKNDESILDMNEYEIIPPKPFKLSLFNQIDKLLSVQVSKYNLAIGKSITQLYESDKIEFVEDLYKNREIILTNTRLYLVSLFAFIYDSSTMISLDVRLTPKPTQLSAYIINHTFNPIYYTPSYYKYLTYELDISQLNDNNKLGFVLNNTALLASGMIGTSFSTNNIVIAIPPTLSTTTSNSNNTTTIAIPTTTTSLTTSTILLPTETTTTPIETTTMPIETTTTPTETTTPIETTTTPIETTTIPTTPIETTTLLPTSITTSSTTSSSTTSMLAEMLTSSALITQTTSLL